MPTSKEPDHGRTAGAESKASTAREQERRASLIAKGQVDWPSGLDEPTAKALEVEVRRLRRFRLIRLIARLIAADLARDDRVEG